MELLDCRSATFVGGNFLDLHDLDGVSTGTMTGTHVAVLKKRRTRINIPTWHLETSTSGITSHSHNPIHK